MPKKAEQQAPKTEHDVALKTLSEINDAPLSFAVFLGHRCKAGSALSPALVPLTASAALALVNVYTSE